MEREICFRLIRPKYAKPSGHKVRVERTADPADVKKAIANMMHSTILETDLIVRNFDGQELLQAHITCCELH
eukprot:4953018-Amphidinium_carterae.1